MAGRCTVIDGVDYRYYQCNSVGDHYATQAEYHSSLVHAARVETAAWAFLQEIVSKRDKLVERL